MRLTCRNRPCHLGFHCQCPHAVGDQFCHQNRGSSAWQAHGADVARYAGRRLMARYAGRRLVARYAGLRLVARYAGCRLVARYAGRRLVSPEHIPNTSVGLVRND